MELVAILRSLWRHRLVVAAIALLSFLAATEMAYRISFPPNLQSRHYEVGIGSASALVDTPKSQVVDLGGANAADAGALSARASLLAALMTSSPLKDEIAARAGVPSDTLIAQQPASPVAGAPADTSVSGATVSPTDPKANILKATVPTLDTGSVPIVQVNTQAADAARAGKLANAALEVLKEYLQTQAATDKVPDARRVQVRQLGPARAAIVTRGPSKMMAIMAGLGVFLFGCGALIGVLALVRGWRRAAELEQLPDGEEEPVYEDDGLYVEDDVYPEDALPEPIELRPHVDDGTVEVASSKAWDR
jgi:hypothetical protein